MSDSRKDPRRLRILLAEDDECVAGVISSGLRTRGHEVIRVTTGKEALDVPEFDVLITDDELIGDMNGVELLEVLGARRSGVPAVFISGHHNPDRSRLHGGRDREGSQDF